MRQSIKVCSGRVSPREAEIVLPSLLPVWDKLRWILHGHGSSLKSSAEVWFIYTLTESYEMWIGTTTFLHLAQAVRSASEETSPDATLRVRIDPLVVLLECPKLATFYWLLSKNEHSPALPFRLWDEKQVLLGGSVNVQDGRDHAAREEFLGDKIIVGRWPQLDLACQFKWNFSALIPCSIFDVRQVRSASTGQAMAMSRVRETEENERAQMKNSQILLYDAFSSFRSESIALNITFVEEAHPGPRDIYTDPFVFFNYYPDYMAFFSLGLPNHYIAGLRETPAHMNLYESTAGENARILLPGPVPKLGTAFSGITLKGAVAKAIQCRYIFFDPDRLFAGTAASHEDDVGETDRLRGLAVEEDQDDTQPGYLGVVARMAQSNVHLILSYARSSTGPRGTWRCDYLELNFCDCLVTLLESLSHEEDAHQDLEYIYDGLPPCYQWNAFSISGISQTHEFAFVTRLTLMMVNLTATSADSGKEGGWLGQKHTQIQTALDKGIDTWVTALDANGTQKTDGMDNLNIKDDMELLREMMLFLQGIVDELEQKRQSGPGPTTMKKQQWVISKAYLRWTYRVRNTAFRLWHSLFCGEGGKSPGRALDMSGAGAGDSSNIAKKATRDGAAPQHCYESKFSASCSAYHQFIARLLRPEEHEHVEEEGKREDSESGGQALSSLHRKIRRAGAKRRLTSFNAEMANELLAALVAAEERDDGDPAWSPRPAAQVFLADTSTAAAEMDRVSMALDAQCEASGLLAVMDHVGVTFMGPQIAFESSGAGSGGGPALVPPLGSELLLPEVPGAAEDAGEKTDGKGEGVRVKSEGALVLKAKRAYLDMSQWTWRYMRGADGDAAEAEQPVIRSKTLFTFDDAELYVVYKYYWSALQHQSMTERVGQREAAAAQGPSAEWMFLCRWPAFVPHTHVEDTLTGALGTGSSDAARRPQICERIMESGRLRFRYEARCVDFPFPSGGGGSGATPSLSPQGAALLSSRTHPRLSILGSSADGPDIYGTADRLYIQFPFTQPFTLTTDSPSHAIFYDILTSLLVYSDPGKKAWTETVRDWHYYYSSDHLADRLEQHAASLGAQLKWTRELGPLLDADTGAPGKGAARLPWWLSRFCQSAGLLDGSTDAQGQWRPALAGSAEWRQWIGLMQHIDALRCLYLRLRAQAQTMTLCIHRGGSVLASTARRSSLNSNRELMRHAREVYLRRWLRDALVVRREFFFMWTLCKLLLRVSGDELMEVLCLETAAQTAAPHKTASKMATFASMKVAILIPHFSWTLLSELGHVATPDRLGTTLAPVETLLHATSRDFQGEFIHYEDGSTELSIELRALKVAQQAQTAATLPSILEPWEESTDGGARGEPSGSVMTMPHIRCYWKSLAPVGGIQILERLEINLRPMMLNLTYELDKKIFTFFFPERGLSTISATGASGTGGAAGPKAAASAPAEAEPPERHPIDSDLREIKTRASTNRSFVTILMPANVYKLSYKGKAKTNLEDIQGVILRVPTIQFKNKTCSYYDLLQDLKYQLIRVALQNTGALVSQKLKNWRQQKDKDQALLPTAAHTPPPDIADHLPAHAALEDQKPGEIMVNIGDATLSLSSLQRTNSDLCLPTASSPLALRRSKLTQSASCSTLPTLAPEDQYSKTIEAVRHGPLASTDSAAPERATRMLLSKRQKMKAFLKHPFKKSLSLSSGLHQEDHHQADSYTSQKTHDTAIPPAAPAGIGSSTEDSKKRKLLGL